MLEAGRAAEASRPQTPAEASRPQTPAEASRPQTPAEASRPQTPAEASRPQTPAEASRPQTPEEANRPQTPEEPAAQEHLALHSRAAHSCLELTDSPQPGIRVRSAVKPDLEPATPDLGPSWEWGSILIRILLCVRGPVPVMTDCPVLASLRSIEAGKPPGDLDLLLAAAYVSDAQYNRNVEFETSPQAIRLYYFYNHWTMRAAIYFFIFVDLSLALFEKPALFPLPLLATSLVEVLCLTAFFGRLVHFAKVTPQMVFWKDTKNICVMVTIVLTLIDLIIYGSLEAVNIHSVRWSRVLRPIFVVNFPESRQIRRAFRSIRNTLPDILYVFLLFIFSVLIFSLMALKLFGNRSLKTVDGSPYFTNILEIAFELYILVTTANSPDVMMPAYDFNWWYSLYFITYIIINTYIFMSVFLAVIYNNYRKHLKNEIRKLAYLKRYKMMEAFNFLNVEVGTEFVVTEARWKQLVKVVAPDITSSHMELLLRICDEERKGHVGMVTWLLAFPFPALSQSGVAGVLLAILRLLFLADKMNFLRLADLLNIQVVTINVKTHPLETWMPRVYQSPASLLVRKVVRHRREVGKSSGYAMSDLKKGKASRLSFLLHASWSCSRTPDEMCFLGFFVWAYDVIILINAIFIALDEKNPFISYAEWVFLSLYIIEILLKLYTYEPRTYFGMKQYWNWFDTLIIIAALLASVATATIQSARKYNSQQVLDIVLILRILRLLRVIVSIQRSGSFQGAWGDAATPGLLLQKASSCQPKAPELFLDPRFRVIVTTLINIGPTMLVFGGLILVVYYAFAIIGMEAFHGKIQYLDPNSTAPGALVCGNPALNGSVFARDRYCKNNFNDIASSFIVLIELTVVNQWHDILSEGLALPAQRRGMLGVASRRRGGGVHLGGTDFVPMADGFARVTHQAAKLYFIGFHVVVVILIVNIFIAFILEAFFVAYSLEKSEVETAIEKKIQELGVGIQEEEIQDQEFNDDNDPKDTSFSGDDGDNKRKSWKGLYFRIASKKYRTVDALLQRIFESDIAPDDEGPSLKEILNFSPRDIYPKNPNFENSA
ncbi:Two pore calcium channel protein 2 [Galemys pyrenaicus]|uniref:Two pore calcium channel protein 2 n=1 Tax=Galemys pyrenaicus TaxID=202257 RepID=A0A8J6DJ78_GALPY|nr:Two pore calcium channel protein 2 [Galemys pyrenaicus]